ncbi:MAG: hypothetical protein J1E43_05150 [Christensenellaceae bacterium]|nr:hypothetical protein [Christensenellaceae bacterium]
MAETVRGLPHVLLIYKDMPPSIRLCGHCQMEALAGLGRIAYRHLQEQRLTQDDLRWADIVLLGRLDGPTEARLAERLRRAGKYLIYILDDDLLHVPESLPSAGHYGNAKVQRSIQRMLELSHAILSPSPLLLEKYAVDGRAALLTREPSINPVPYKPHDPEAPVRIGFAGSADRAGDVARLLGDALQQIKREYGDRVQIEFFGFQLPLAKELDAKTHPYASDYDSYRAALNDMAWDIGLAPMPDEPFHACKHYNKFVEYAAAGTLGVFSDVEPYRQLKRDIGLGVFCPNETEAWVSALRGLIEDHDKREALRRQACECAADMVSVESVALQLDGRMTEVWQWRAEQTEARYPLKRWKLLMRVERMIIALQVYKGRIFLKALDRLRGRG